MVVGQTTARRAWVAAVAALMACSTPATTDNSGGAGLDTQDPGDSLLFKDGKHDDAPAGTDASQPADAPDGQLTDTPPDAAKPDIHDNDVVTASPLCRPCVTDGNCGKGGLCLANGADGAFCSQVCDLQDGASCPADFHCATVKDGLRCVPDSGACTCGTEEIAQALTAACVKTNSAGTCKGVRTCTADGFTPCDAATPATETCNGVDDDCNGKTDDLTDAACSNTNAAGTCAGKWTCQDSVALCDAATPVTETCNGKDDNCDGNTDEGLCDDGNPCTTGICGSDGSCGQIPESGAACDDGSVCTDADVCDNGKCKGVGLQCDDGNPCTTDGCTLAGGCTHSNAVIACADDGNSCTIDACSEGVCAHIALGDGATCKDDGNPCTLDGCVAGACLHTDDPFDPPCADDNNACTQDVCKASACAHLAVPSDVTCTSDGNACTDDLCQNGACGHPAVSTPTTCDDDGNACSNDVCGGGKCTHPAVIAGTPCSDDGLPCTDDVCQTGTCAHPAKAYGAACADDGLPCTADTCKNGVCTHLATLNGQSCPDDGDPCTVDTCTAQGGCGHAVAADKCIIAGVCYASGQASANDPCKQCLPAVSQSAFSAAVGKPCEDGNLCTVNETCTSGTCQGGVPKDCSGQTSTCGVAACDKATGECVVTPKSGPCDDSDVCTASDHCEAGKCVGTAKDCSPFDSQCTTGTCVAGNCSAVPKIATCDDGDPCTQADACAGPKCVGTALDCSGLNSICGTGSCKNGTCIATPKVGSTACDDSNGCTFNDQCTAGLCVGTTVNCSNLDGVCQTGVCDPATTGCILKYATSDASCSDGDACSQNDHCDGAGKCTGSPIVCKSTGDPCSVSYCAGGKCQTSSAGDGNTCSDGSSCTKNDVCSGGVCKGTGIYDQYEPNNTSQGTNLGSKSDCAGSSTLGATISPAQDQDFFHYAASDDLFCSIYPDVALTGLNADYDLCVWFRCNSGESSSGAIGCDAGYKASGGPDGMWGCCSNNSGTANEHVRHNDSCTLGGLGDDGGTVVIQVFPKDNAAANMCGGYTLTWKAN